MKWPILPLTNLCRIETGKTPSRANPEYFSGDNVWVTIADLNDDIVTESKEHVTNDAVAAARMRPVSSGTVLLSYKLSLGKLGIAGKTLYTNEAIAALPPHPGIDLVAKYLFFALRTVDYLGLCHGAVKGKCLNRASLSRIPVPFPPPAEQRRIVEILDQADALRKKRTEADAKAARILPALFYKMFGDAVVRPMGWVQAPLSKLLRKTKYALQSGPFGSQLHNHDFIENGTVLAVGIDNVLDSGFEFGRNRRISEEKYQELIKFTLEPGDVLITIMGTIGRVCVFPKEAGRAICTKHVYRIQVDNDQIHSEYLSSCFQFSQSVRSQLGMSITGQIVAGITSNDLKNLIIDTPPIDLQNKFAELKNKYRENINAKLKSDNHIDRLFNLLLYKAFTGDLTAKWREAHMKELLAEMEGQAKALGMRADQ